jgi:hypothetical protein
MVEIRTQNPYEIDLPFDVKEGKYTVQEGVIEGSGNTDVGYFASPVHKGDFVKLETGADWLVSVAGENDTIIGEVLDHPQFYGDRPQETANDGSYTRRKATIRLWGDYVKALKLVDDNSAVTVGNAIAYAGSNEFDKGDSGDAIALESAKANSGKKIAVLLGYRGL